MPAHRQELNFIAVEPTIAAKLDRNPPAPLGLERVRQGKSDHTVANVDVGNRRTTTDMSPPGRSLSRDNTADDSSNGTLPGEISSISPQAVLQCNSAAAHSLSTNATTGCNATVLPLPSPPHANSPPTLLCPSLPHGDVPSDEVARDNHNYIPPAHLPKPDSSAAIPMTTAKNDRSLSVPPGLGKVRQWESYSEPPRVGSENPETTTTAVTPLPTGALPDERESDDHYHNSPMTTTVITPLLIGALPDEVESDDHYHNLPVQADDESCLALPLTSSSGAISKIEVGMASQQTQVLHEPAAATHSCSICDFASDDMLELGYHWICKHYMSRAGIGFNGWLRACGQHPSGDICYIERRQELCTLHAERQRLRRDAAATRKKATTVIKPTDPDATDDSDSAVADDAMDDATDDDQAETVSRPAPKRRSDAGDTSVEVACDESDPIKAPVPESTSGQQETPAMQNALPAGTPVRLQDLHNAKHLNGEIAVIVQFLPASNRYDVILDRDGTAKAVRPAHLSTLLVLDELRLWRRKLLDPSLQTNDALAILERLLNLEPCHKPVHVSGIRTTIQGLTRRPGCCRDVVIASARLLKSWDHMT